LPLHTHLNTTYISRLRPHPIQPDTLSLHDALPLLRVVIAGARVAHLDNEDLGLQRRRHRGDVPPESQEEALEPARALPPDSQAEIGRDTSELQSRGHLVCRLLLEKKKIKNCWTHMH